MAIDKGNIKTSANYDVKAQKPLDARAVRPTKADLINRDSWSADGSTVYAYEGMQVYVQDEKKTYYLKDISKMFASDFSGWELMGTGAAAEVEVDTELSETSENAIANSTVSKALAAKQDLLMNGINIKTVNGQNILGRGNIEIEVGEGGEGGAEEVYIGTGTPPESAKVWINPEAEGEPSQPTSSVEVIDNLESDKTDAALSANQGRVLKEMIGQGGASGGNANGVTFYGTWSADDARAAEKQAHNAESFQRVVETFEQGGFPSVAIKDPAEFGAAEDMGIVGGYGGFSATYVFLIMPNSPLAEAVGMSGLLIQSGAFAEGAMVLVSQDGSVTFA